jgi:hypothetical protein
MGTAGAADCRQCLTGAAKVPAVSHHFNYGIVLRAGRRGSFSRWEDGTVPWVARMRMAARMPGRVADAVLLGSEALPQRTAREVARRDIGTGLLCTGLIRARARAAMGRSAGVRRFRRRRDSVWCEPRGPWTALRRPAARGIPRLPGADRAPRRKRRLGGMGGDGARRESSHKSGLGQTSWFEKDSVSVRLGGISRSAVPL